MEYISYWSMLIMFIYWEETEEQRSSVRG